MRFRQPFLAILLGLVSLVPGTPALAGSPGVSLQLQIGGCRLSAETSNIPDNTLTVVHRAANGSLKATHTLDVSIGGFVIDCPGPRFRSGDKITLRTGAAKTRLRTFTVPDLTIKTDRGFDKVTGTTTGVTSVDVRFELCGVAGFGCTAFTEAEVPVNPTTHRWSVTSTEDLRGGSEVMVIWEKGSDRVLRLQRIAQVIVSPGSAIVVGTGRADGRAEAVTLRRGDRLVLANPVTNANAGFRTKLKRNGAPVPVRKGDIITSSVAGDATFVVPTTALEVTGDGVAGKCRRGQRLTVLLKSPEGNVVFGHLLQADATGDWSLTTALPAGGSVESWCATSAGDAIVRRIAIPD
jgi:hypothetical protein